MHTLRQPISSTSCTCSLSCDIGGGSVCFRRAADAIHLQGATPYPGCRGLHYIREGNRSDPAGAHTGGRAWLDLNDAAMMTSRRDFLRRRRSSVALGSVTGQAAGRAADPGRRTPSSPIHPIIASAYGAVRSFLEPWDGLHGGISSSLDRSNTRRRIPTGVSGRSRSWRTSSGTRAATSSPIDG